MDNLLRTILEIQSVSFNQKKMKKFILKNYGGTQDKKGNIYITKGKADVFPCVVAHLDTVHDIIKSNHYKVCETGGNAFAMNTNLMQMTGVGGDDKCGIYIALKCLEKFDNIKIAFFVDEEIGCVGSQSANMKFFKDTGYVIQPDRQGYTDVVTNIMGTQICSIEFQDKIKKTMDNYAKAFCKKGGLTDVYQLVENGLNVSCLNLSCGYYNPHTPKEYINLEDLEDTKEFVFKIIDLLGNEKYNHTSIITESSYDFNSWENEDQKSLNKTLKCTQCGSIETEIDYYVPDYLYCYACMGYVGLSEEDIALLPENQE
jgi:tripeptide aminopeptidase